MKPSPSQIIQRITGEMLFAGRYLAVSGSPRQRAKGARLVQGARYLATVLEPGRN